MHWDVTLRGPKLPVAATMFFPCKENNLVFSHLLSFNLAHRRAHFLKHLTCINLWGTCINLGLFNYHGKEHLKPLKFNLRRGKNRISDAFKYTMVRGENTVYLRTLFKQFTPNNQSIVANWCCTGRPNYLVLLHQNHLPPFPRTQ